MAIQNHREAVCWSITLLSRPRLVAITGLSFAILALPSCATIPPTLPGLDERFTHLPIRSWLVEGPIQPMAIAYCEPKECGSAVVIGLFEYEGSGQHPDLDFQKVELLFQSVESKHKKLSLLPAQWELQPVSEAHFKGFSAKLKGQSSASSFSARLLSWKQDGIIRFVFALGSREEAVHYTALQVLKAQSKVLGRKASYYNNSSPASSIPKPDNPT